MMCGSDSRRNEGPQKEHNAKVGQARVHHKHGFRQNKSSNLEKVKITELLRPPVVPWVPGVELGNGRWRVTLGFTFV